MTTYGPWLSRDPCLWGERAQSEWIGSSYAITNHVIVCNAGEEGHTIFHEPFGSDDPCTVEVVGKIVNIEDGSGFRPMVYGVLGPELRDECDVNGNFAVQFEIMSPTGNSFGLRSTGNGNAQVAVDDDNGRFDFRHVLI